MCQDSERFASSCDSFSSPDLLLLPSLDKEILLLIVQRRWTNKSIWEKRSSVGREAAWQTSQICAVLTHLRTVDSSWLKTSPSRHTCTPWLLFNHGINMSTRKARALCHRELLMCVFDLSKCSSSMLKASSPYETCACMYSLMRLQCLVQSSEWTLVCSECSSIRVTSCATCVSACMCKKISPSAGWLLISSSMLGTSVSLRWLICMRTFSVTCMDGLKWMPRGAESGQVRSTSSVRAKTMFDDEAPDTQTNVRLDYAEHVRARLSQGWKCFLCKTA